VLLQLLDGGANAVHTVFADVREALRGVVPIIGKESIRDNSPFALRDNSLFRRW
jgi:isopentenyl diphosphate isomerase/L-lactate dehydrogenase-like FMN-dependent dehydrogenase